MKNAFIMGDLWLNIDGETYAVIENSGDGWVSYITDKREVLTSEDFISLFYPCNPEKFLDNL